MSLAPLSLDLAPDRLRIVWTDRTDDLPAAALRAACRCGGCRSARLDGQAPDGWGAVLGGAVPIGAYAVQLRFTEGHDRGIYPWAQLRELADGTARGDTGA